MLVGDVSVAAEAYVDHGAVIESAGPPVRIGEGALVLANAVVRSVGGHTRPRFAATIGAGTLISPLSALAGCTIGEDCYLATGAIVLQGARVGPGTRIGARALIHADVVLGERSRVGMGCYAVPGPEGSLITEDVGDARRMLAKIDFFDHAFGVSDQDQRELHRLAIDALRREVLGFNDEPV